ncbi:MAG: bifunctional 4-hydroxy-2-oxoglutarate aldolase/2-dehydro-3-deoxy-phosphogluconate aldolase, partial [Solirubrobacteraceae bacterium]
LSVAQVLAAEGLEVLEVTFRTIAAPDAIRAARAAYPTLFVGAGTLLSPAQVDEALAAGAQFGVAPGLSEPVLSAAREHGLPFLPGVATPSEIERGLSLGLTVLKWFPAEALGGPRGLSLAAAPFLHTGVRFVPSGGITAETAPDYLRLPSVLAVGGSWMAPAAAVIRNDQQAIATATRAAVSMAKNQL